METDVIIYTMSSCMDCKEVKTEMVRQQITFAERDIVVHESEWDEVVKDSGQNTVPTLIVKEGDDFRYLLPNIDFYDVEGLITILKNINMNVE